MDKLIIAFKTKEEKGIEIETYLATKENYQKAEKLKSDPLYSDVAWITIYD